MSSKIREAVNDWGGLDKWLNACLDIHPTMIEKYPLFIKKSTSVLARGWRIERARSKKLALQLADSKKENTRLRNLTGRYARPQINFARDEEQGL
jgi:hypothetical protein